MISFMCRDHGTIPAKRSLRTIIDSFVFRGNDSRCSQLTTFLDLFDPIGVCLEEGHPPSMTEIDTSLSSVNSGDEDWVFICGNDVKKGPPISFDETHQDEQ